MLSQLGTIGGSPGGLIEGAAAAAGAIDQTGGLTINGTVSANTEVPTVPTQTFPQISYVAANWTGCGLHGSSTNAIYGSQPGANDCTKAYSWIRNAWTGSAYTNVVVRIAPASPCIFTARQQPHELGEGQPRGHQQLGVQLRQPPELERDRGVR